MTKHKNAKSEFNVEETLSSSEAFLVKNKKNLIGGLIAIVVIIAGVLIYKNAYASPREKEAQVAMFPGEKLFAEGNFTEAIHGDSINFDGFIALASRYSSTKAGNLANYYIGISYQRLGQFEEAIKYLEKFNGKDQMVYPTSRYALANCYADAGQLDKAVSTFKSAATSANNNTISPIALRSAGELLEKQGKFKEALTEYTKVKEAYAQSIIAQDIDKYIARAEAQIK